MEHEIVGHTRKIYKIIKMPGHSTMHKIKDIGIEILIIVFAVALAGLLERWREAAREDHEVKDFILGLREDLKIDLKGMEEDSVAIRREKAGYLYFALHAVGPESINALPDDSVIKYINPIFNQQTLLVRRGRYEGFKSANRIGNIKNVKLKNDILSYYEDAIPIISITMDYNNAKQNVLHDMLLQNWSIKKNDISGFKSFVSDVKVNNYMSVLAGTSNQTLVRYHDGMQIARKVLKEIDEEYGIENH